MKIFCDFHHGALVRWMFYLFADRLGHELWFPGAPLVKAMAEKFQPGTWGAMHAGAFLNVGITQEEVDRNSVHICETEEEFCDTDWDAVLLTRIESQVLLGLLGHPRPGTKYIGVSGNEGSYYNWGWVKNVLASDLDTFNNTRDTVHKLHSPQELGRHYDAGFIPIKEEHLHNVYGFLNNLKGYDHGIQVRNHPTPVNICKLWHDVEWVMADYNFKCWGHGNENIGTFCVQEADLAGYYREAACTWHYKTYDGYGHALLQGIPCGRPVIVPRGFHDDRTAGKYLIEGVTAFRADYTVDSVKAVIELITCDLDTANAIGQACYDKSQEIFNWAAEAEIVREWMGGLR